MADKNRPAPAPGRIVMLGFGSIGQASLALLLRQLRIAPSRLRIISRSPDRSAIAAAHGVEFLAQPVDEQNYESLIDAHLSAGDFLLNLSVDVSSLALMRACRRRGILYLDTCTEPWPGRYDNPDLPLSQRTNYALREEVLAFQREQPVAPTAVVTCGANPGVVSILVKQALLNMAADCGLEAGRPAGRQDWARLAQRLGVRVIHVAERDSQVADRRKQHNEFVNTWSVDGFVSEGLQPSELGWGSHERHWPADAARQEQGCGAAIYLRRPGIATRVRSWTPLEGGYQGFLVTHAESVSIADHLTLREGGEVSYRPTVHYAYHPCDDTVLSLHELAGKSWRLQGRRRILRDEIRDGRDELGVLLMGNPRGVYWYGSRLSIGQARELAPHNSATSLQVVAGILGGMVWALRHPLAGVVEPDDLDHDEFLELAAPYLGRLAGVWSDWTPLKDRTRLFDEPVDRDDPWQFLNFRVN
jgi:homospermidine synthase